MAKKSDSDDSEYNDGGVNDDTFGLPDIDYKPLDPNEEEASTTPPPIGAQRDKGFGGEQAEKRYMKEKGFSRFPDEEEERSSRTWLWILFLILMVGVALFLAYKYLYQAKTKGTDTELSVSKGEPEDKPEEADKPHEEPAKASDQQATNTIPAGAGSIEELSARTERYYIVVSSSVDGDLAMDYAKKLKRKGLEVKLIKSRGQIAYTRVAIVSYATLDEARLGLDVVRQQYGSSWVLKY